MNAFALTALAFTLLGLFLLFLNLVFMQAEPRRAARPNPASDPSSLGAECQPGNLVVPLQGLDEGSETHPYPGPLLADFDPAAESVVDVIEKARRKQAEDVTPDGQTGA